MGGPPITDQEFREDALQRLARIETAISSEGGICQRIKNLESAVCGLWNWQRIIIVALIVGTAVTVFAKYL